MKLLVAVSGGVDSVILLDMLANGRFSNFSNEFIHSEMWSEQPALDPRQDIIVAHFEHGIRGEASADDQKFVRDLAAKYNLPFVTASGDLGSDVSEASARDARYDFLRKQTNLNDAVIVTAHHADDVVETIAINLVRGTGWRGLAVLDSGDIYRPLLHMTKCEILEYARAHNLEWREDGTNQTDVYLRNRLRRLLEPLEDDVKYQLLALRDTQVALKHEMAHCMAVMVADIKHIERTLFDSLDDSVADEIIRLLCFREFAVSPARPARRRILEAIRTLPPAKVHQSTDGIDVILSKRSATFAKRAS